MSDETVRPVSSLNSAWDTYDPAAIDDNVTQPSSGDGVYAEKVFTDADTVAQQWQMGTPSGSGTITTVTLWYRFQNDGSGNGQISSARVRLNDTWYSLSSAYGSDSGNWYWESATLSAGSYGDISGSNPAIELTASSTVPDGYVYLDVAYLVITYTAATGVEGSFAKTLDPFVHFSAGERYPWGLLHEIKLNAIATLPVLSATDLTFDSIGLSTTGQNQRYASFSKDTPYLSLSATGTVDRSATLAVVIDTFDLMTIVDVSILASLNVVLDGLGFAARNQENNEATFSVSIPLTLNANGVLFRYASVSVSLDTFDTICVSVEPLQGAVVLVIDTMQFYGTDKPLNAATLSSYLGFVLLESAGVATGVSSDLEVILNDLTLESAGGNVRNASLFLNLGDLSSSLNATCGITASFNWGF